MFSNMFLTIFVNVHLANVWFAFSQSNLAGKVIVVLLVLGSVFAWSVMLTKIKELRQARMDTILFLNAYRKESHPASLFLKRRKFLYSPLYSVYEKACLALGTVLESRGADPDDLFMGGVGKETQKLTEIHLRTVRNVAERTVADHALLLESNMGLLATATTTAPFLGLLGTVWGVMESFGGMVVSGSAMLSAVAPGISGALLTTVVGLLVALPSAIGYNMLSDKIGRLALEIDNFCQELMSDIERHYLQ